VVLPSGNEASGNIIIGVSGGTGEYTYSLNNAPFTNSNEFTGLTSGDYSIEVRDVNGCNSSSVVVIEQVDIDNSVFVDTTEGIVATYKNALSYQWINVGTGERIPGATSVNYIPTVDGNYQVEMEIDDTIIVVSAKGIKEITNKAVATQTVLSPIISFTSSVLSIDDFKCLKYR